MDLNKEEKTNANKSKAYDQYEDFTIGNVNSKYVMYIGIHSGTAGDVLTYHNGVKFTTKDKDNVQHSKTVPNCTQNVGGTSLVIAAV